MLATNAAPGSAPNRLVNRRAHDPDAPYLVPPIAAGHKDPIVRALVGVLILLYHRRGALREVLLGRHGKMLFPALPEFLARPPKRAPKGELPPPTDPDLDRRRSDGIEAIIRVLLVLASCCDWKTMQILDPGGGFLSVKRIAELADLPWRAVWPGEDDLRRSRFRMDTVERVLRLLRTARILCFTKQHREQLEDGRHTATAPALRKLSVKFFEKFGGEFAKTFKWRRDTLKDRAEKAEKDANRAGQGIDIRFREEIRRHGAGSAFSGTAVPPAAGSAFNGTAAPPPVAIDNTPASGAIRWRAYGEVSRDFSDAIAAEHPDWSFDEIMKEAQRRLARSGDPPISSSSEPPKTN